MCRAPVVPCARGRCTSTANPACTIRRSNAASGPADQIAAVRKSLQALIVFHMEREPRSLQFLKTK